MKVYETLVGRGRLCFYLCLVVASALMLFAGCTQESVPGIDAASESDANESDWNLDSGRDAVGDSRGDSDVAVSTDAASEAGADSGKCVGCLPNGKKCTLDVECLNKKCIEGYCCKDICRSHCMSCAISGSEGKCTALSAMQQPKGCSGAFECDGKGQCRLSNGQTCGQSGVCASNFCVKGICCESKCSSACESCKTGKCIPYTCVPKTCEAFSTCDGMGGCKITYKPSATVCRSSNGSCDEAERCSGNSSNCPKDVLAPATMVCRQASGSCDKAETCTGTTIGCPKDVFAPAKTICRPSAGMCDVAEVCNGNSPSCPKDVFEPATKVCRNTSNFCDLPEKCTGTSASCPMNQYKPNATACNDQNSCTKGDKCDGFGQCKGVPFSCIPETCEASSTCDGKGGCKVAYKSSAMVCRPSAGPCDIAEKCTGSSSNCPNDALEPATKVCRKATSFCDMDEKCTGTSASCPSNQYKLEGTTCNDGKATTCNDTCNGSGVCTGTACYYVDATKGDNTTGDGSQAKPWKTVSFAIAKISGSGVINVAPGVYDTVMGGGTWHEIFPINIKAGISIVGQNKNTTIIDAKKTAPVFYCNGIGVNTKISNLTIRNGRSISFGMSSSKEGNISLHYCNVTISNNIIETGSAYFGGAGVQVEGGNPIISNNLFRKNSSSNYGGVLDIRRGGSAKVIGNSFIENSGGMVNFTGGAIYLSGSIWGGSPVIMNNFIQNTNSHGISVMYDRYKVLIVNNSISGSSGNGIRLTYTNKNVSIVNNIFYNNYFGIFEAYSMSSGNNDPVMVEYNLFYNNKNGHYFDESSTTYKSVALLNAHVAECKYNLEGDPVFFNPNSDLHINTGSAAIDAGTKSQAPAYDIDGDSRPQGKGIDIGADEIK